MLQSYPLAPKNLLLPILIAAVFFVASSSTTFVFASEPVRIQGYLREDVLQKPVSPGFEPGRKIEFNARIPATITNWCPIPEWLAGTWECSEDGDGSNQVLEDLADSARDLATRLKEPKIRVQSDERFDSLRSFGTMRDRNGGIWHYLRKPYGISSVGSQSHWTYYCILDEQITEQAYDRVLHETIGTQSMLYQISNVILFSTQVHNLTVYRPLQENLVQVTVSNRAYDSSGKPIAGDPDKVFTMTRIKPFHPIKKLDGQDLAPFFRDYLVSHGKGDLVPASTNKH